MADILFKTIRFAKQIDITKNRSNKNFFDLKNDKITKFFILKWLGVKV